MKKLPHIWIGAVRMTPPSTRERPWAFQSISEAQTFAVIACRYVWAKAAFDPAHVYRVWPGGRLEKWPAAGKVSRKNPAFSRKHPGTASGTSREKEKTAAQAAK